MTTLKDKIMKKRGIAGSSANTYISALKKLRKAIDPEAKASDDLDIKFLTDYKTVMNAIEQEKTLTSKKNKLTAVIVALDADRTETGSQASAEALIGKFSAELKRMNENYMSFLKEQKKTDKQSENWITYDQLNDIIDDLGAELKNRGLLATRLKKEITRSDFDLLQQYVILNTYMAFPLRNDFANMSVITKSDLKEIPKAEQEANNYLVIYPQYKAFHINSFKTKKAYGNRVIPLGTLTPLINKWLRYNTSGWLFVRVGSREPMNPTDITKYLNRIFKARAEGKKISSSMLRHIIISHSLEGQPTLKEKEAEEAKAENTYFHSATMNQLYRKVDN